MNVEMNVLEHPARALNEPIQRPSLSLIPKLYKRRWIIIFLYILYAALNAFHLFGPSIVANVVTKSYIFGRYHVEWISIIYTILYLPLMVLPALYLMQQKGLRTIALIGAIGTALVTILKMYSLNSENGIMYSLNNENEIRYLLNSENEILIPCLAAESILSSMQVFILSLPPQIAATWFGPKEVSLACALMVVFGMQLGQGLGFYIPLIVENYSFKTIFYGLSIYSVLVAIAIIKYFPDHPPEPSNDHHQNRQKNIKLFESLNRGFIFHAIAYGINNGVFSVISITLVEDYLVLLIVIANMIASIIFGYVLDKTHAYKQITLGLYCTTFIGVLAFIFSLHFVSDVLAYSSAILLGVSREYITVGLELAIELTYPKPESTTSGIFIALSQIFSFIITSILSYYFYSSNNLFYLIFILCFLFLGLVLTIMIPNDLKRQNAFKHNNAQLLAHKILTNRL